HEYASHPPCIPLAFDGSWARAAGTSRTAAATATIPRIEPPSTRRDYRNRRAAGTFDRLAAAKRARPLIGERRVAFGVEARARHVELAADFRSRDLLEE